MTNQEVSAIFTDIYNGFCMKHRDSLPNLADCAGWDAIIHEGHYIMNKYNCHLATDLVSNLIAIMDQRAREENVK